MAQDQDHRPTKATMNVTVSYANGSFQFAYSGDSTDGNLNFKRDAKHLLVEVDLVVGSGVEAIVFDSPATDACWIVRGNQCPAGPYSGDDFRDFTLLNNGTTLQFTDLNEDGHTYSYMLRMSATVPGSSTPLPAQNDPKILDRDH